MPVGANKPANYMRTLILAVENGQSEWDHITRYDGVVHESSMRAVFSQIYRANAYEGVPGNLVVVFHTNNAREDGHAVEMFISAANIPNVWVGHVDRCGASVPTDWRE